MIDDIVEMVLKEARIRDRVDLISNIYSVMMDIEKRIVQIMENIRIEERRKEQDENKG